MDVGLLKDRLQTMLSQLEGISDNVDVTINDGNWDFTKLNDISLQGITVDGEYVEPTDPSMETIEISLQL